MSDSPTLKAELRELLDLRAEHARVSAEEKRLAKLRAEQERVVHELMQTAGLKSLTTDLGPGYGTVRFVPNITRYSRVLDAETLRRSIEEEGLNVELLEPKFRQAPLNELVRERLENGRPLPEGLDFYDRKFITVTRT